MSQLCISTFIVMILIAAALPAFGFILERPNNILAFDSIPANWNIAPSLKVEHKSSSNQAPSEKVPVANPNKQTQVLEPKNLSIQAYGKEREIKTGAQITIDDKNEFNIEMKSKRGVDSHVTGLRNVVLFLVTATDKKQGKTLRNISPQFEVEGSLETCHNGPSDALRFFSEEALLPGKKEHNCNCEHFLRMNIGSLLMWARHESEMATGTVLSSNFTLPSLLRPHRMQQYTRPFNEFDESRGTPEIPKVMPEVHDDWFSVGFQNYKDRINMPGNESDIKDEGVGRINMWSVVDEFSKLRLPFFHKLLEGLTRNLEAWHGVFDSGRPHRLHSNLTELTANTIRELKSVPSEKGYMMVVAAPEAEAIDAIEFLRREITQEDTLFIVTEVCPKNSNRMAFSAQGPASKALREATMISELPTIIKDNIIPVHHEPLAFLKLNNYRTNKPDAGKREVAPAEPHRKIQ